MLVCYINNLKTYGRRSGTALCGMRVRVSILMQARCGRWGLGAMRGWGNSVSAGLVEEGEVVVVVNVGCGFRRCDVYGSVESVNTSPDTKIGSFVPNVDVRISRASRLMGVLLGVFRVRG